MTRIGDGISPLGAQDGQSSAASKRTEWKGRQVVNEGVYDIDLSPELSAVRQYGPNSASTCSCSCGNCGPTSGCQSTSSGCYSTQSNCGHTDSC